MDLLPPTAPQSRFRTRDLHALYSCTQQNTQSSTSSNTHWHRHIKQPLLEPTHQQDSK